MLLTTAIEGDGAISLLEVYYLFFDNDGAPVGFFLHLLDASLHLIVSGIFKMRLPLARAVCVEKGSYGLSLEQ